MAKTYRKQKRVRRGGKNTQKNYTKKGVNDPDNDYGVVTCLEPDIFYEEIMWALGSKMPCKCYTQYARKFGKLSSGHRMGKGQFSF